MFDSFLKLAGLLTAALGIFKYFNYRSRRDRLGAVGQAFGDVVEGLSSDEEVTRLANAVLLRRFFDPRSEFALRSWWKPWRYATPYATDGINVIAAVLRTEGSGPVQKTLADCLAYAP